MLRAFSFCIGATLLLLPLSAQRIVEASSREPELDLVIAAPDLEVESAVERGLAWLAAQQNENGFWYGLVGSRGRGDYRGFHPIELQVIEGSGHVGVTALCGMAFLSGGHLPGRGKYGVNVERATQAVLSSVQDSGLITAAGTRMYSHAFAALFLAEVYGMSADPRIREGLEKATHIIIDIQNAHGAWRYNAFSRDSDLSVTVCQLQALRAARNIGIRVPRSTIDRAVEYVRQSQVPSGRAKGLYYYSIHGRRAFRKTDHYSIQAAAVTSLLSAGIYERELIEPVLDFLAEEMPYITEQYPHHYYFWYGNYYACQVFFHADGLLQEGCFKRYYRAIREHLLRDQRADGRWLNPLSEGPGDAFGTAVACILLQVPKQYLPIFQR